MVVVEMPGMIVGLVRKERLANKEAALVTPMQLRQPNWNVVEVTQVFCSV